jgi:hypothetical protein
MYGACVCSLAALTNLDLNSHSYSLDSSEVERDVVKT